MAKNKIETRCEEILLSKEHQIFMRRFYVLDHTANKKYLKNLIIEIGDEIIANNFSETIQFKEELFLFFKGDVQNKFLKLVSKTINKKEVRSLMLQKKDKSEKKIFISQAEAKTIASLINYSTSGFSLTKIFNSDLTDAYSLHIGDMINER